MVVVFKQNIIEIYDGYKTTLLNEELLCSTTLENRLVFVNLNSGGAYTLIKNFLKRGYIIKDVVVFNLRFYSIYVESTVFKCFENFGIGGDQPKIIFEKLLKIDDEANKSLNTSLYNHKINSLAGLGLLLLEKSCGNQIYLNLNSREENIVRQAFYGGRQQIFQSGSFDNIWAFDFKSMYAKIMLGDFPTKLLDIDTNIDVLNLKPGFYKIVGIQSQDKLPILPIRKNGVFYLTGQISGIYWYEEINLFIKNNGRILEIEVLLLVGNFKKIFRKFTKRWLEEKKNNVFFSKQLMNGVYGRLAINSTNLSYKFKVDFDLSKELEDSSFHELRMWGDMAIIAYKNKKEKIVKKNLIAAAIVASRARIKMYETLDMLLGEGLEVYSIQTDAIYTNKCFLKIPHEEVSWTFHKNFFFKPH